MGLPRLARPNLEDLPFGGAPTLASLGADAARLAAVAQDGAALGLNVTTLRGVGGYSAVFDAEPATLGPCVLKVPWVFPGTAVASRVAGQGLGPYEVRLVSPTGPIALRAAQTLEEAEWLLAAACERQRESGTEWPLPRLFDQPVLGGVRCALSERIDGASFGTLMRASLGQARALVGPLALALDALHARFGAHGDLKPEHVLCQQSSGALVLLDPLCGDADWIGSLGYTLGWSPLIGLDEEWVAREADRATPSAMKPHLSELRKLADLAALAVVVAELWGGNPRWTADRARSVANVGNGRFAGFVDWAQVRRDFSEAVASVPEPLQGWADRTGLAYIDSVAAFGGVDRLQPLRAGWCHDRLAELAAAAAKVQPTAPRSDEGTEPRSELTVRRPEESWETGRYGTARVVRRVHAGRCFDVYLLDARGTALALKVASEGPQGDAPTFGAERIVGSVSTVWDVRCEAGRGVAPVAASDPEAGMRAGLEDLLEDEAERLRAAGRRWNHEIIGVGRGRLGGRATVLGLVTPWHAGVTLESVSAEERRRLLVRMLPALWDALAAVIHGDLNASNIILASDWSHFALVDPGAQVLRHRSQLMASDAGDTLTFVTTPETYPVVPPYYCPEWPLARGASLAEHWDGFLRSMTISDQAPPFPAGRGVLGRVVSARGGRFLVQRAAATGEPHPADLLAVGILYYEALTGAHPFPQGQVRPAWLGPRSTDDRLEGVEAARSWITRPPLSPAMLNPTVRIAEERLALALLDLQVPSRERLLELVRGVFNDPETPSGEVFQP